MAAVREDFEAEATARGRRMDSLAVLCALLAMGAIATNALFLQKGPHPAPIFSTRAPATKPVTSAPINPLKPVVVAPAPQAEPTGTVVLPRPRPAEPETAKPDIAPPARPRAELPPVPPAPIPVKATDAIGDLISPPTKRVAAVQRVLTEYGYGQIKPTGVLDRQTEDAIEQFERSKKLQVTRQISPRLMRELAALTGRPVD